MVVTPSPFNGVRNIYIAAFVLIVSQEMHTAENKSLPFSCSRLGKSPKAWQKNAARGHGWHKKV